MAAQAQEDAKWRRARPLLLVLFFVFVVLVLVDEVAIFCGLLLILLIVLLVRVIGDNVQVDGMRLRDLEFGFAFGTAQDLAFFDFVFVDIDFVGTFRATDHGSTLRPAVSRVRSHAPSPPLSLVLYTPSP